jgi:transcriptional regulator with GAF, ATPase, and Fis domain
VSETTREAQLLDAFATLADTLVVGYDVVDLLQTLVETCADVLDVAEAGILLSADDAPLELVASTSEKANVVETIQLAAEFGPCIACFRSGAPVSVPDLAVDSERWPEFARSARSQGFVSVYALPLRLRADTIGTLNLFGTEPGVLNDRDVRAAQALADVATIGILHERNLRAGDELRGQLQRALESRVVIEQAKGVLAHSRDIAPDDAFAVLRRYARSERLPLDRVAREVVERRLTI